MHTHTNRLIHESSPYLLQHAHNPVDWYPWNDEAFEKAKKEDKPVLVSIGYAACHWCHVMERESFEDAEVAAFMNEHFINIKVDREERPDVDHIYMDAVQTMTGGGGWPLNVFLTPQGKPFYGGTYYPPKKLFNRSSWVDVLSAIAEAYTERKEEIEQQAESLTRHLKNSNAIGNQHQGYAFDKKAMDDAFDNIMKSADKQWGGFGRAPKFPQTFTINFLLRYSFITGNQEGLNQAFLSLDKMLQGGIYDQIGGGFARYSTDSEWLAPHFEKMLYDNALLIGSICEAYQITGREHYRQAIEETLRFVERELTHKDGGFFSALDADSEGEEGKFYVWQQEEIESILGADAPVFNAYFNVSKEGNWEGKNILHSSTTMENFATQNGRKLSDLKELIKRSKHKLLEVRNSRIRPLLDDKLLLSWNALMNIAFSKAYGATGKEEYKLTAEKNMMFLLKNFSTGDHFYHTWKNGKAKHPAFLDDYAFLIAALLELAQITADTDWLDKAKSLTRYVIDNFSDDESTLFFYTQKTQTDVLLRKKEVYDSAIPSGNSVMAHNLYRLSIVFDKDDWREKSGFMLSAFGDIATRYPTSFGFWLSLLMETTYTTNEIAITGPDFYERLRDVLATYFPHSIIMSSDIANDFPLLKGKESKDHTLIYLCKNYTCLRPVESLAELKSLVYSNFLRKNTIIV